jgi:hypothetical protein
MACSVRVQTGATEPIEVIVFDILGVPLTGKTDIKVKVRRISDSMYYDWTDNYFKVSPVRLEQVLEEISASNSPGEYRLNLAPDHINGFNTGTPVNKVMDDTYEITVVQDGGSDASNLPQIGEIKVGQYVDEIPDFNAFERAEIKEVLGITGTGTPNDSPTSGVLSIISGLVQQNFFLDETSYSSSGLLTTGRIRIFPTKAATDAATDGGVAEGDLAAFRVTTVPNVSPLDCQPKTYKVTRES